MVARRGRRRSPSRATRWATTSSPTTRPPRGCSTGQPAYDTSFEAAGGFGLFYYPPTFIPLVLPFGLLAGRRRRGAWIAAAARRVRWPAWRCLPVRRASAGSCSCSPAQSWPFLYAIKLGQVGPLLFLLFAIGWRWMDTRPVLLGVTGGARGGDQDPARAHPRVGAADPPLGRGGRRRGRPASCSRCSRRCSRASARGRTSSLLVGRVSRPDHDAPEPDAGRRGVRPGRIPRACRARPVRVDGRSRSLAVVFAALRLPSVPVVPGGGGREPAPLADPVGPLRAAAPAARRVDAGPRPVVGGRDPARDAGGPRGRRSRRGCTRSRSG